VLLVGSEAGDASREALTSTVLSDSGPSEVHASSSIPTRVRAVAVRFTGVSEDFGLRSAQTVLRTTHLVAEESDMPDYIPSTAQWVRDQVELYERTNGAEGYTLRDTGMPVMIVTNVGNKTGGIRKTPLMRVKAGDTYVAIGSKGGAPAHPAWVHNLRANPDVTLRDRDEVSERRAREVTDPEERGRLWAAAVEAYPPYAEYQQKTDRIIPVFALERR